MSHGASACFADVVTPANVIKVFPILAPLFDAVTTHAVWGLLEYTTGCRFDSTEDVRSELKDVLDLAEGETEEQFDARIESLTKSFRQAIRKLQVAFHSLTGAEIDTTYLDEDTLDGYADIKGRFWYIYEWQSPKPKVAKAVRKGLKINRAFYAVYG